MRTFLIESQNMNDERRFTLREMTSGERFEVDIFTDGKLTGWPEGADATDESWRAWLNTFVGKAIEVERISPYLYFTGGETRIIN